MEKTVLDQAVKKAQDASNQVNKSIAELGECSSLMFTALTEIQNQFDLIKNVPSDKQLVIEELKKTRVTWKQQVKKIEEEYKKLLSVSKSSGAAGTGVGVAVVALGPTAAMGIATTFGVASTGTAISALSGAAATNAALAWLGGGAIAAGGGGMIAGNALLSLAGPVGWGIAAFSIVTSGLLYWKAKKELTRLENIYTLISERDVKKYNIAIIEIEERIKHIFFEHRQIIKGIKDIKTFGYDYRSMTSDQQYALGTYVNLMEASTKLMINPIIGLQPSYTEEDCISFCKEHNYVASYNKKAIIYLANLLYKVKTNCDDREVLTKSFKQNEEFLMSLGFSKDNYPESLLSIVDEALNYKYSHPTLEASSVLPKVDMQMSVIERVVKKIIAKACDMYTTSIQGYQNISCLGANVEIVASQLENIFGISIPDDYVRSMHTVDDAIRFVENLTSGYRCYFNIRRDIYEIIAKTCDMYTTSIQGYQNISCLGGNVEIVVSQFESAFGISIPDDYVRSMHTVDDAVRIVSHLLQNKTNVIVISEF